MSDERKPKVGFWITVAILVAVVAYPLSIGPAFWIYQGLGLEGKPAGHALQAFYAPLEWLHERSNLFSKAIDWYLALWEAP